MLGRQNNQICDGVNISYINISKFKISRLSFTVFVPLSRETAAVNAVLFSTLERCCRKYPDFSSFNKKLEELYGANIYSSANKIGEAQALTVSAVCINDNTTFDKSKVTMAVSELLSEIIFNPCLEGEKFREEDVLQAKRQVKETIQAEHNDKKIYAKRRCEELMFQDESFGISEYGKEEDVEKITAGDVFDAWENILGTAKIEIIALGDFDYNSVHKLFSDKFSEVKRQEVQKFSGVVKEGTGKVREFEDLSDVSQCKLVLGLRTGTKDEKHLFATKLMTALFGGTPTSKLFLNVREALSLCYYCSANFDRHKGVIFVESGIEQENMTRAKEEILKQLDEIKKGNFSDEELNETKMHLSQNLEKIEDSLTAIDGWYISQVLEKKVFSPQTYASLITSITKSEVIEAANNVKLDTIYCLLKKGV